MKLYLNDLGSVREETLNGREYLVAPTKPIKAMDLDQGYVPQREVSRSEKAWNGTPVTLNHPHDENGNLISASGSPKTASKTNLGYLYNVKSIDGGEMLQGEVWIDRHNANAIGGEAETVVEKLENGDKLSVSTSYFGDRLEAGEYDGKYREKVIGNLRPDHLALLPNKEGRCSIDDGCLAGEPAANSLQVAVNKSVAGVSFEGKKTGKLDKGKIDSDEHTLSDHYLFGSGDVKDDFSYPVVDANKNLRKGNVGSAFEVGASGEGVTKSELHSKLRKLNKEWSEGSRPIDQDKLSSNADDSDESGGNTDEATDNVRSGNSGHLSTMDRESYISFLVENHGFKEDSLEGMGDSCLQTTYESFNEDTDDDDGDSGQSANSGGNELAEKVDQLTETVSDMQEDMLSANEAGEFLQQAREKEKQEELVDEIVSNSEKYDREELEGTETSILEKIKSDVVSHSANYAGQIGGSARVTNDEDTDLSGWENRAGERMDVEGDD